MHDQLLRELYHSLFADPNLRRTRDCRFCDAIILLIYFHAVLSNRSTRWASQRGNWPLWCRQLKFPSYSQLRRRLGMAATVQRIEQLNRQLRENLPSSSQKLCDGKALMVGGFSKDPDARRGPVPGGMARGYKLHVIADSSGAIDAFAITSLNRGEATIMRQMLQNFDLAGMTLRADANYDSNPLYHAAALAGGRLIAPRAARHSSLGHRPQHPHRRLAIAQLEATSHALIDHKLKRNRIEQSFAHLGNLPFGLWALPNFVRRLPRVRLWIAAKIMLYHLHLLLRRRAANAA